MLIKDGFIVDGSGNPWFRADIRVRDGRIADIGILTPLEGERILEAKGLVVAPGFIDIHSHSDWNLLANPRAESKVHQGVTTEVNGNCGISAAPITSPAHGAGEVYLGRYGVRVDWHTFAEYLARLERQGVALNVITLVGHGTIRSAVMGDAPRLTRPEELGRMKDLVAQALEEGALGLSTGLEFVPGRFSDTEELVELCRVVARYEGFYATHQRNRDLLYEEATKEAIEIGKKAGLPVHLSHFVVRVPAEGKSPILLGMVDRGRREGVDITCDVITPCDAPRAIRLGLGDGYHWAQQSLAPQLIPPWGFEGGLEKTLARLGDPRMRQRFATEHIPQWKLFGIPAGVLPEAPQGLSPRWNRILLNYCRANPELNGKTFAEIAEMRGKEPREAALDILLEEGEKAGSLSISILGASTAERDSLAVLKHPTASICSDRGAMAPYGVLAEGGEPNSYGAFPRVFRKYVRERGLMTVEEAVQKMTSLPAQRLGLRERGMLRKGMWADMVIFDAERIADRATIEEPAGYPEGIEYVLVNGELVIDKGEHTGALPGRVLRRGES